MIHFWNLLDIKYAILAVSHNFDLDLSRVQYLATTDTDLDIVFDLELELDLDMFFNVVLRPLSSSNFRDFPPNSEDSPKVLQMSSEIRRIQPDIDILPQQKAKWGHIWMQKNKNEHKSKF